MSQKSSIEWTTHTWNPTTGCSRVGPECDNCYAMNMAHRFSVSKHLTRYHTVKLQVLGQDRRVAIDMVDWTGAVEMHPERLSQPFRWRAPAKIFVDSMSDLFHPKIPFSYIAIVFGVMACAQRHTFQVLTKRPEREAEFFQWLEKQSSDPLKFVRRAATDRFTSLRQIVHANRTSHDRIPAAWPALNIWLGTSVGVRDAKWRIDALRDVPAHVRFLSLEPLLEDLGELDLSGIGWVIAGGESGARARPMHPDWVRRIRDQCDADEVPFFFKQHGAFGDARTFAHCAGKRHTFPDGQTVVRIGKKKAGRELDGHVHDAMPATA